jgi:hypothetical protein
MPAISNFAGAKAAGFVGNSYLPSGFNDVTHAGQRATLRFGVFAAWESLPRVCAANAQTGANRFSIDRPLMAREIDMNLLFRLSNLVVLPFWALMMFLPRWRWTARIMRSPFVSALLAAFYAALVLPRIWEIWPAVSLPTLSGVANNLPPP